MWGSRLSVCLLPPSSSFCKLPRARAPPSLRCYFVLPFLLNRWFSVIAFHQKDLEPLRNADTHVPFQSKSESLGLRARHRGRQSSGPAGCRPPDLEAVHSKLGALEAVTQGSLSSLPPQLLEAESWLEERGCALDIEDEGQSAEATRTFLRRLEATRRDLEAFRTRIERLQQTAAVLESRQNPERSVGARPTQGGAGRALLQRRTRPSRPRGGGLQWGCPSCHSARVLARLRAVREAHSGLLQRAEGRGQGLREQLKLHQLEREALLLETWLASKVATAESQDHGQDLEAVEVSLP